MDVQELKKVAEARWDKALLSILSDQVMERLATLENEGMLVVYFDDAHQAVEFVDDNTGEIIGSMVAE